MLDLGLVTRIRDVGAEGGITAMRDVESRIESEAGRLERMEKSDDQITRSSDSISDDVRKGKKQRDLLLRKARQTLAAHNVQLVEEGGGACVPDLAPRWIARGGVGSRGNRCP